MAADSLIYCLEQLTDYEQFERLCHDLMALDGYKNIEPLGGSKDKGRDAIHTDRTLGGLSTIFAYSVREDWRTKLEEDATKVFSNRERKCRLSFSEPTNRSMNVALQVRLAVERNTTETAVLLRLGGDSGWMPGSSGYLLIQAPR